MTIHRICAAVRERRDAMLELLEQTVNLDSPTEEKVLVDRVAGVFQAQGERLGMRFEIDPQPIYGDNRVGRLGPVNPVAASLRVLLIGHVDTVYEAGTTAQRPFRVDGDRAYGPAVLDMKSGLVIGLFALEALLATEGVGNLQITFIFNTDEEPGSPRSRDVIQREAVKHDLALILEPGRPGPAVTVGRKGVGIFRLAVMGIEAHAGTEPEKGANAIVAMARKADALYRLIDLEVGTTVNPGVVSGGTKPYVVPGQAELVTDIRVPTRAEQERVLRALEEIVATTHVPGTASSLSGGFHRPPMEPTAKTYEYVRLLQGVSREVGRPLGASTSGGASDGNLTAALGIPTIDGLGAQGARAHSPEEYIELDSLEYKCTTLAGFLHALADANIRRRFDA